MSDLQDQLLTKGESGSAYPTQQQPAYPQQTDPPPPYQQQPLVSMNVTPDVAAPVSSVYQPPAVPGQKVSGVYEQGARFDPSKQASIPPPPPGVAPTAAQVAAAQGQPVVMTQQKKDKWGLGSDGGATFF
ncbi:DAZ-associated protein 2-like [Halichondria panicea]|uniref:DAZ-associated protein 2-like n=1 Tax=Halichondria panicea TaxID=6063 RepID=UPI00312BC681